MSKHQRFFICKHCGNLIGMVTDKGVPIHCCGEKMTELVPNTVEASVEKHLPVVTPIDNGIHISIGSVPHPMTEEHHIQFVYVETERGGQRKCIPLETAPEVDVLVTDDTIVAVYAYCNLHGLWKTEL